MGRWLRTRASPESAGESRIFGPGPVAFPGRGSGSIPCDTPDPDPTIETLWGLALHRSADCSSQTRRLQILRPGMLKLRLRDHLRTPKWPNWRLPSLAVGFVSTDSWPPVWDPGTDDVLAGLSGSLSPCRRGLPARLPLLQTEHSVSPSDAGCPWHFWASPEPREHPDYKRHRETQSKRWAHNLVWEKDSDLTVNPQLTARTHYLFGS